MGKALTTGPNGPQTPATAGVAFQRRWIVSGSRRLDSYEVRAAPSCVDPPTILIYHGVQETISVWVNAQKFLYDHCVSSVVFDPSGSGDSSRPGSLKNVNADALAAFEDTRRRFGGARLFVMSHSMGAGPMLQAAPHFSAPPAGVIVASPFSSLRAFGGRANWFYGVLANLSPDWWNNVEAVRSLRAPLLVIHSDSDQVNPAHDSELIFAAAAEPKRLVLLHGFRHNALYQNPTEEWWAQPLAFVGAPTSDNAKPSG